MVRENECAQSVPTEPRHQESAGILLLAPTEWHHQYHTAALHRGTVVSGHSISESTHTHLELHHPQ